MLAAVESVVGSEGQSQSQLAVSESAPLVEPRCRRSAKWGLEDNTACYGQEKLSVNIAICLSLSLNLQKLQPLSRIKSERYIFIKRVAVFLPS